MKKHVLVVEDEKKISRLVEYNLEKAGFRADSVESGEDALRFLEKKGTDLLILDLMLPGMDGLEVCRAVKKNREFSNIPVVMLTAKGEEVDRIVGFELGADDYVIKPFSPRELVLRIKAILKRTGPPAQEEEELSGGIIRVNIPRHEVTAGKKKVELTRKEFDLLVLLMRRRGRVQSRDRLLCDVWDMASSVTTRTVDTHIKRLREKLGKGGKMIRTVRGIGYKFMEQD